MYFDVGPGIRIRFWWLVDVAAAVVLSASGDISAMQIFCWVHSHPYFCVWVQIFLEFLGG